MSFQLSVLINQMWFCGLLLTHFHCLLQLILTILSLLQFCFNCCSCSRYTKIGLIEKKLSEKYFQKMENTSIEDAGSGKFVYVSDDITLNLAPAVALIIAGVLCK